MEKYYRINFDPELENQWFLGAPVDESGKEIAGWHFTMGKRWEGEETLSMSVGKKGVELSFSFGSLDMPVIREDLLNLLMPILPLGEVQLIPVTVKGSKNKFYIFNALRLIDCIDESKSDFDLYVPSEDDDDSNRKYECIYKLIIDTDKTMGAIVFRHFDWDVALIVHEKIKKICEKNKIIGLQFTPVTE